jgi:hypothetical protein
MAPLSGDGRRFLFLAASNRDGPWDVRIGRTGRYVATRDGQHFLMIVPEKQGPPPQPVVIVNWPSLLVKK